MQADNGANGTVKLSSGAIAGIVIGCLVVLIIAIVFGLRKRTVQNRLKLRGKWISSKSLKLGNNDGKGKGTLQFVPRPYTYNPDSTINGQGLGESMGFSGTQGVSFASAATGGIGYDARGPVSPKSMSTLGLGLPQAMPSAYGSDGLNSAGGVVSPTTQIPVLYSTVVVRSFVPTLPDELSISSGERLKVLQEFDDGWAECMNMMGETGMVPLECFEKGGGVTSQEERNSRRYTSLPRS